MRVIAIVMAVLWGGFPVFADDFSAPNGWGKTCSDITRLSNSPRTIAKTGGVVWAFYAGATNQYPHGVLGDTVEATYVMTNPPGNPETCLKIIAPDGSVFEDVAPRLADLNGDGVNEVIVVESDFMQGARLAVYRYSKFRKKFVLLAATAHIGHRFRWLAPVGIADFDGDGRMDIAYVDRPHLRKTLRVVSYEKRRLIEIAQTPNLSNHRIGETVISGGVKLCSGHPSMITANADWTQIIETGFVQGKLQSVLVGPMNAGALDRALSCP